MCVPDTLSIIEWQDGQLIQRFSAAKFSKILSCRFSQLLPRNQKELDLRSDEQIMHPSFAA
jgi:hypothetical protein